MLYTSQIFKFDRCSLTSVEKIEFLTRYKDIMKI
jgi:hypothetical protein